MSKPEYFIMMHNPTGGGSSMWSMCSYPSRAEAELRINHFNVKDAFVVSTVMPEEDDGKLYSVRITNTQNGAESYLIINNETKWVKSLATKYATHANWMCTETELVEAPEIDLTNIECGMITLWDIES